jgi:hypothetical protein
VFWRYAVPILIGYAALVPVALGGASPALLAHVLAGILAWIAVRLFPWRPPGGPSSGRAGLRPRGVAE